MALWNFSPRRLTPRTPPLCWGGASTAPPPGRSGCSGVFALGLSPLDPTHLDGTQSKFALVTMPMTLKPVPGQGMSLRPLPRLPRGSRGKEQLKPLSLASCPPPCPGFSFKGVHPGFHTTLATLGHHLLEVWGSSGTAILSGFHIVPFSMVLKMHTSSRPCFHPSGPHTYLQEWDCRVPWWFQLF